MAKAAHTLAALCAICLAPFAHSQSLDNTFDIALGTAGLNRTSARFSPDLLPLFQDSSHRTLLFKQLHANPWLAPDLVANYRGEFAAAADNQADIIGTGARLLGANVRRTLLGDPLAATKTFAAQPRALESVLQRMRTAGILKTTPPPLTNVPSPVQEAAALVLATALENVPVRRNALGRVSNPDDLFTRAREANILDASTEAVLAYEVDFAAYDLKFMNAAAQDTANAASSARSKLLGVAPNEKFEWRVSTTWGEIMLSGGTDNTYDNLTAALVIDTGGNDTYIGMPANRSIQNWISLVFDSAGNDKYLSHSALANRPIAQDPNRKAATGFGPGSALLGITMLYDIRGNDLYRSSLPGLGFGHFGFATVCDSDGDDIYDAYQLALGAGIFGMGLLEDLGGKDKYSLFTEGQGFGGPMGVGMLFDRAGDDSYVANDTVLDFPSAQSAQHNNSMAQGAGYGRRADYLDGHSISGGIGVLYDLEGNDSYSCGVFGQGVGYWEGSGFLWDRVGNDTFHGQWYVQGASAHFAIGYLEDENGDDVYNAEMNMAQGAGHDFGFGMLLERNGNDRYKAPNLSLGSGNANGMGLFMDFQGDDTYASIGLTLGRGAEAAAGTVRSQALTFGLFYDGFGTDQYPENVGSARNGARITNWTDKRDDATKSQMGVFWDR